MRHFFILGILFFFGCASNLKTRVYDSSFVPENKNLIFLSGSDYNSDLRSELTSLGFTVHRFASQAMITEKSQTRDLTYNQAEAKYGVEITKIRHLNTCIVSSSEKINVTVEITDILSNEVILSISKGGWTEDCGIYRGGVLKDLAEEINKHWKSK